jgi:hypothetical protein
MKVLGLNKIEYNLDLTKYIVREDDQRKRSKHHISARHLLREIFKGYSVLEEVKLPGSRCPSKKSTLFLDFFIPSVMIGVEVHGKQHYEYTPFFHKSKADFKLSQNRDRIKSEWCKLNNITLVEFMFSDSVEQWRKQIERL